MSKTITKQIIIETLTQKDGSETLGINVEGYTRLEAVGALRYFEQELMLSLLRSKSVDKPNNSKENG